MDHLDLVKNLENCLQHAEVKSRPWLLEPAYTGSARPQSDGVLEIERIYQFQTYLHPDQKHFEILVSNLKRFFAEYLNPHTDRFGNGLLQISGGMNTNYATLIDSFAQTLITATSQIGAKRVGDLLLDWKCGNPLHFRKCGLLVGMFIDENLCIDEHIKLSPLPHNSKEVDNIHPDLSNLIPYLSRYGFISMVSIDCRASPIFYSSENYDDPNRYRHFTPDVSSLNELPEISLRTLCESLCLVCNHPIHWIIQWRDLGDAQVFVSSYVFYEIQSVAPKDPIKFEVKDLNEAVDLHRKRYSINVKSESLERAIRFWIQSKTEHNREYILIYLRIAFEALYELAESPKISSHLAKVCALHLGGNAKEKRKIKNEMMKFYDAASKAVHASASDVNNTNLILTALDRCRLGIIKRIDGNQPKKWQDLPDTNTGDYQCCCSSLRPRSS